MDQANAILQVIILAVSGWCLLETISQGKQLSALSATVTAMEKNSEQQNKKEK